MNKDEQVLQWALEYLVSDNKYIIVSHQQIAKTSYSTIHKFATTQGVFYLKQTPQLLFQEAKTLAFLNREGCRNIPEIVAENSRLHCFMMPACGDESLRHLFKGKVDSNLLDAGISNYTSIQRILEENAQQLLSLGMPDWRLEEFPSLYNQLIQQEALLISDGLTKEDLGQLHQLYPLCVKLCEDLTHYKIPETISHCDFHENNMLLDKKTRIVTIIDWGEVVLSHPFFSLSGLLWNITYFNEVMFADLIYKKLQSQCIAAWQDLHNEEVLIKALTIANQLNGVYAALGYERLYSATEKQSEGVAPAHRGAIASCLRAFLGAN